MYLAVLGRTASPAVLGECVVFPGALPELVGHVEVLPGPVVRRALGHDVPRDPSLAGVIKGRHAPGEVERVLLTHRGRERDADMVGDVSDRACQHRGVAARCLEAGLEGPAIVAAPGGAVPDDVGEEDGVEPAALQCSGETYPVLEFVEVSLTRQRAAPAVLDDVPRRARDEGREMQRAWC